MDLQITSKSDAERFLNILRMLLSQFADEQFNQKEVGSKLLNWLNKCSTTRQNKIIFDGLRYWTEILPQSLILDLVLRDSLLKHRWKETKAILDSIANFPNYQNNFTLLRIGLHMHFQMNGTSQMLDDFITASKSLYDINKKQLFLDYFLYNVSLKFPNGLNHRDSGFLLFTEISQILKQQIIRIGPKSKISSSTEKQNRLLFDYCYVGFASYIKWLLVKWELEDLQEAMIMNSEPHNKLQKTKLESIIGLNIKTVCNSVSEIEKIPGVWDIFICKHIEVLEYQNELNPEEDFLNEAEIILQNYLKMNPDNPNASKFLYYFYKKHNLKQNLQIQILQDFCSRVPYDRMVFVLSSFANQQERFSDETDLPVEEINRVKLLFNMLDYSMWRNEEKPWSLLANEIIINLLDPKNDQDFKSFVDNFKNCWIERVDWWPGYHFSYETMFDSSNSTISGSTSMIHNVDIYKACVASLCLSKENSFSKIIKKLSRKMNPTPSAFFIFKKIKHLPEIEFV